MEGEVQPGIPTKRQQSWGALVSIIVIVLMIVIGAYYAWHRRAAEQGAYEDAAELPSAPAATSSPL